jgi:hypothetical protein
MRMLTRIVIILFFMAGSAFAFEEDAVFIGGHPGGAASYCDDTLFCFEEGDFSWDGSSGVGAEDCDGYDSNGDWCDQDTTAKNGTYSLGVRGDNTHYLYEDLSSDSDEFHYELWFRVGDVTGTYLPILYNTTSGEYMLSLYISTSSLLKIYMNNGSAVYTMTGVVIAADTWYHVGVYYKAETAPANNDGIARVWIDTDGTFDAGELELNKTNVDTGSNTAERIRMRGGNVNRYDDVRIIEGSPSWPTS